MNQHQFIFSDERKYRLRRHLLFWLFWWIFFGILYSYTAKVSLLPNLERLPIAMIDALAFLIPHFFLSSSLMYYVIPKLVLTQQYVKAGLLVLFFFPVWNYLKKYAVVYRSLEGINAAVVGIMIASTLYIMRDISLMHADVTSVMNMIIIVVTFLLLRFTRIQAPFIVAACLALGYFL